MTGLPDFYAVLGVLSTASRDEIRAAYRRLARQHHPDVNPLDQDDAIANEFMCRLNEAYEVLNDPKQRAGYDRQRLMYASPPWSKTRHHHGSGWSSPPDDIHRESQTYGWHSRKSKASYVFYGPPMPDWLESFIIIEKRFKARLGPFLTLLSVMTPVLVLSGLIIVVFWLYLVIRADPGSWGGFIYLVNILGETQEFYILGILFLGLFAVCFVWWRSFPR